MIGAMQPPKVPRPTPVPRVRSALLDTLSAEDAATFWERTATALPLVEPADDPDHVVVTFCWRDPNAEQVLLFANRLADETSLADTLLERIDGTDIWHASFLMGADWRASYCFLVQEPGQPAPWLAAEGQVALRAALDRGRRDPRNPRTCRNRAGVVQSVAEGPAAPAQPWLGERPDIARGSLTEHTVDGRMLWLYDAPGTAPDEELPVVVVLDGEVWTQQQRLPDTLDNLVSDDEIPPVRALFVSSGGIAARWSELGAEGDGAAYVVRGLLPWLREHRSTPPAATVVVGQSLGGLTALRAGLTHPEEVAGVVSHSASLWADDLSGLLARGATPRVHLAHGSQEWVLAEPHADLADRLRAHGVPLDVSVHNGGHDYAWWRGGIADGLRWVLGGRNNEPPHGVALR